MQTSDLKFPGGFTSAQTIRREVAHEISQQEIAKAAGAAVSGELAAFLLDAATKTPGYVAPPPALAPTEAVVANGKTAALKDATGASLAVNGTIGVLSGQVNGITLPSTIAGVKNAAVFTLNGNTYTFTVAGGKITNIVVAPVA